MDRREQVSFDQQLAAFRETIPRLWWTIYQGALQAGFDPKQAFACLTSYILSQSPGGIRPDSPPQPEPDK